MRINTNNWNRIRYTLLTPVYDWVGQVFRISRQLSINSLKIKPGEKILLVGAGTGLDLEFLPPASQITATDLTPTMVTRIKKRSQKLNLPVTALVMDGHHLGFANDTFDKIILHLILAVIPDPVQCLQEAERVLKPGGQMTVFDKFLRPHQKISPLRKFLNIFTNILFSDITRSFEAIRESTRLEVVSDIPADFGGNFRMITLYKRTLAESNPPKNNYQLPLQPEL